MLIIPTYRARARNVTPVLRVRAVSVPSVYACASMTTRNGGPPRITRRAALAAMQQWIETHGRIPVYSDWEIAGHGHPCAKAIDRHWGWDAFRAAAVGVSKGRLRELTLHGRPAYPLPGWPRSELLQALIDHYVRECAWPTGH